MCSGCRNAAGAGSGGLHYLTWFVQELSAGRCVVQGGLCAAQALGDGSNPKWTKRVLSVLICMQQLQHKPDRHLYELWLSTWNVVCDAMKMGLIGACWFRKQWLLYAQFANWQNAEYLMWYLMNAACTSRCWKALTRQRLWPWMSRVFKDASSRRIYYGTRSWRNVLGKVVRLGITLDLYWHLQANTGIALCS